MRRDASFAVIFALFGLLFGWTAAAAEDRRTVDPYHYPPATDTEVYRSDAVTLPEASENQRVAFVIGITEVQMRRGHALAVAIFSAGEDAEQLVIIATGDGRLNTKYRARALFSTLTSLARATPMFSEFGVETVFTFFDLAKMLGFTTVTASDGRDYTYQVIVE